MSHAAPSEAQIRELVIDVRKRSRDHGVIGIHTRAPWNGRETMLIDNETLRLVRCASTLEIREELIAAEAGAGARVILTTLTDGDLEADVRARLARGRVLTIKRWDAVRMAYQLREIDPRLEKETWLAEALLELRAGHPARVVPSGFLDVDTAWDMVTASMGLPPGRVDVLELLRWAEAGHADRLCSMGDVPRDAVRRRFEETAGSVVAPLLACLADGPADDAVPLGLVCGALFSERLTAEDESVASKAAVRMERFCGNRTVGTAAGRAWADAAETLVEDVIESKGLDAARATLQRADVLLAEIEGYSCAHLGRYSFAGFEQRLARFADALSRITADAGLAAALDDVRGHGLARLNPERLVRTEMAYRLVAWLTHRETAGDVAARSLVAAAQSYAASSSFVDWVRSSLEAGDSCQPLSAAYGKLLDRVASMREKENERFGALLTDWVAVGGSAADTIPIEDVLSKVVAPLAEQAPVLLLVMDGMSMAVFRELGEDLGREGWIELVPDGAASLGPVIAAFPTVTEVCRASLLAGHLAVGQANVEKAGFARHELLRQRAGRKKPPVLFHKSDLVGGGAPGLAAPVRDAIADPGCRVVGVVVNAVDDHLAKGDQIRPGWNIGTIRPLRGLLHASQQAGRVVIITSDHGHVPERGGELRSHQDGERWRADDGARADGEVVLAGPRVMLPASKRLIAPWGEGLRYGQKKNGYHGGASPQEVVVPIGVFSADVDVKGWTEIGARLPDWWTGVAPTATVPPVAARRPKPRVPQSQKALFDEPQVQPSARGVDDSWVDELLRSATWKAQAAAVGRVQLDSDRVREALFALEARGDRLTRSALGHKLGLPAVRVNGFVVALRRILNVDGYYVLEVDEASDTLILNRELLRTQFELA